MEKQEKNSFFGWWFDCIPRLLYMLFLKNCITNKDTVFDKVQGYKKNLKRKYILYILAIRTEQW